MYDYYVIKHDGVDYLYTIFGNSVSYTTEYYDATKLSTENMAREFKNFCQEQDSTATFAIYGVTVTITEVTLNALGE